MAALIKDRRGRNLDLDRRSVEADEAFFNDRDFSAHNLQVTDPLQNTGTRVGVDSIHYGCANQLLWALSPKQQLGGDIGEYNQSVDMHEDRVRRKLYQR